MNKAEIGTIIRATMRPQDVIPSLMDTLHTLDPKRYQEILESADSGYREQCTPQEGEQPTLVGIAYHTAGCIAGIDLCDDDPWWDSEDCLYFLNDELWDTLNEYAPPYCYFGSHPGDGSDYGFWPDLDAIDDLASDDYHTTSCLCHGNDYNGIIKVSDLSEVPNDYTGDVCIVNDHGNMTVGHHTADSCFSDGTAFKAYWGTV